MYKVFDKYALRTPLLLINYYNDFTIVKEAEEVYKFGYQ